MLRINLLPPYIYAGKKKARVWTLWIIAVLAVAGGFIGWKVMLGNQVAELNKQAADLEPRAKQADDMQAKADSINKESETIVAKANFVREARSHTEKAYPTVVYNVRDYTIRTVLYSSLDPQGDTVSLSAYAPSLADVGHYMMWMERNASIRRLNIGLSGLPSFPVQPGAGGNQGQAASGPRPPGARGYDFTVQLTLVKPIPPAPTYGGAGQAAGGGAGTSPMGAPSGMMGPMGPGSGGAAPMIGPGSIGPMGASGAGARSQSN
jgi:Tfp pilus assembly protein PilN